MRKGMECAATYREIFLENKHNDDRTAVSSCDRNAQGVASSRICVWEWQVAEIIARWMDM